MTININFNLPFNEAIAQMASRGVVLPELYYGQLQGIHRQLAFSIANIAKVDQLQAVLDSLTNHLKNGGTFAQWQKAVDVKTLGLPKHRLDNIFRTNIQQAYNHGHWQQALSNKSTHGYLLYDAINDSRTRPSHRLNDGIIRKIDDPIWKRIWFSRNVYRCRCRLISLTEKQAIARSANDTGLYKTATEDPLRDKAWDSVDVMNNDMLGFGVERAIANRMTAGKVDEVLLSALDKQMAKPVINEQPIIKKDKSFTNSIKPISETFGSGKYSGFYTAKENGKYNVYLDIVGMPPLKMGVGSDTPKEAIDYAINYINDPDIGKAIDLMIDSFLARNSLLAEPKV
jgi:SPP1 gp7 family putative phage head morphogenesis protein